MRAQLAAYRRDDWSADEMRALNEHLATCASCRQVEAAYRRVGESLRLLPTLTPDASFRERVFAAIAAERRRMGPAAMRATRAETEPSLPVVRAPVLLPRAKRRVGPMPLAAMVAAAVLLLSLGAMQLVTSLGASNLAANFSRGTSSVTSQSRLSSYLPDQRYFQVNGIVATRDWLAYTAGDGAGGSMLIVVDRHNGASHTLLTAPVKGDVALVSLTAHWVVWSVTTGAGWSVSAAPVTGANAWRAQSVAQSATTTLTGVWANDTEAMVAQSAGGQATLERMTITSSATSAIVVATGSHQGAVITSPWMANGAVYWADVWADSQGALHSAVWREMSGQTAPITQAGGEAFAPVALSGRLLWINATRTLTVNATDALSLVAAARQAAGKLVALDLAKAQTVTLSPDTAAASVHASDAAVLWTEGLQIRGYDFGAHGALAENSMIARAQVAGLSADALGWFDGSHIAVYALS